MNCSAIGGPDSVQKCPNYFVSLWEDQVDWLKHQLAKSTATWRIVVTHVPPEPGTSWEELARDYGIDLIVTGHIHYQLFWGHNDDGNPMKPTSVLISGGGGGITSENVPREDGEDDAYGFVDLALTKDTIELTMISHGGKLRKKARIPHCYGRDGADTVSIPCHDDKPSESPTPTKSSEETPADESAPEDALAEEVTPEEPAPGDPAAEESAAGDDDRDTDEDDVVPTLTDRLKQMLGWSRAGQVLRSESRFRARDCAIAFAAAALSSAVLFAAWRALGDRRSSRTTSQYSTLDVRHVLIDEAPGLQL